MKNKILHIHLKLFPFNGSFFFYQERATKIFLRFWGFFTQDSFISFWFYKWTSDFKTDFRISKSDKADFKSSFIWNDYLNKIEKEFSLDFLLSVYLFFFSILFYSSGFQLYLSCFLILFIYFIFFLSVYLYALTNFSLQQRENPSFRFACMI